MKIRLLQVISTVMVLGSFAVAAPKFAAECQTIVDACTQAGFVQGEAKQGKGLWLDCVDPIMQGTVAKKSVIPLPGVQSSTIATCAQKSPKFGHGKVAN